MNSHPDLVCNLMRKGNAFIAASICNTWAQWLVHISTWRKLSLQIRNVPTFDANARLPPSPRKPPGSDRRTSCSGALTTTRPAASFCGTTNILIFAFLSRQRHAKVFCLMLKSEMGGEARDSMRFLCWQPEDIVRHELFLKNWEAKRRRMRECIRGLEKEKGGESRAELERINIGLLKPVYHKIWEAFALSSQRESAINTHG